MEEIESTVNLESIISTFIEFIKNAAYNRKKEYTDTLQTQSILINKDCELIAENHYIADLETTKDLTSKLNRYREELDNQQASILNRERYSIKEIIEHAVIRLTNLHLGKLAEIEKHYILSSAKLTHDLNKRLTDFEEKLSTDSLPNLKKTATDAKNQIKSILDEIKSLSHNTASEIVFGNYKDNAAAEKQQSDKLRIFSIIAMSLAIFTSLFFVLESLYWPSNTSTPASIALRIIASILLSVPAAYFARESSKHRRQQYLYQQYALNLNAISPFIAELDKNEKNALKAEVARKIFTSSHEAGACNDDSYPINAHELLALLINKIDFNTQNKKPDN